MSTTYTYTRHGRSAGNAPLTQHTKFARVVRTRTCLHVQRCSTTPPHSLLTAAGSEVTGELHSHNGEGWGGVKYHTSQYTHAVSNRCKATNLTARPAPGADAPAHPVNNRKSQEGQRDEQPQR